MKAPCLALLLLCAHPCPADEYSGPDRTTIQRFAWGSIYYAPGAAGQSRLGSISNGFQLTSSQGQVAIETTDIHSFRLTWGNEVLTVEDDGDGVDIRGMDQTWSWHAQGRRRVLRCSTPRDTLVFNRSARAFTIYGARGEITVAGPPEKLTIRSPLGTTVVADRDGQRTLSGVALEQIPYLGRGIYIPFHGAGIFIDVAKAFPMPEVEGWVDWRPIL